MPVTARMLETMIRLTTAFAKTRLARKVTVEDAEKAFNLITFACFKEVTVFFRLCLMHRRELIFC